MATIGKAAVLKASINGWSRPEADTQNYNSKACLVPFAANCDCIISDEILLGPTACDCYKVPSHYPNPLREGSWIAWC